MYILHGTWLAEQQLFALWGEDISIEPVYRKGRRGQTMPHPYLISIDSYLRILDEFTTNAAPDAMKVSIQLPGKNKHPYPSMTARQYGATVDDDTEAELLTWELEVITLQLGDTLDFFLQVPIEGRGKIRLGQDMLFWQQASLLAMNCLAEGRYIPALSQQGRQYRAYWEARPEPTLFSQMAAQMPAVCRAMVEDIANAPNPQVLLQHFLSSAIDSFIREQTISQKIVKHTWLKALTDADNLLKGDTEQLKKLYQAWEQWRSFGTGDVGAFRISFRLNEPVQEGDIWQLDYLLQSSDDPSLIVDAEMIWAAKSNVLHYLEHRFDNPQEKLLAGLGLASRLFEPIERSLRQARPTGIALNREEAYQFLTDAVPILESSGFAVLVPNWWGKRRKIKAKASFKETTEPTGFLTKDTLLNYEWKMSLGDETISKEEFEALVALKQPLVRYKGEWVALDSSQIESALKFFEQAEEGEINLLDALKMKTIESDLEDIEIEDTELADWLEDIFGRLRNPDGVAIPETPEDLQAQLRPYQERGFGWLVQMRQMGIGACLADDMGLGKAQPLTAKILTPSGWKCMGEIQVGDKVINSQGTTSHITGVYPQGEKDVYRVLFRDGSSTECCDDHLWAVNSPVRNRRGNPYQILSLHDIRQKLFDGAGNARHYIPMVKPIEFDKQELPLDPYFLGVLIGDGGIANTSVVISTADEEILEEVASAIPDTVSIKKMGRGTYDYRISGHNFTSKLNPITRELRELGLMGCRSHEKFIPQQYLYTALEDRIACFQGIMDTDGTVRVDNTLEYCTTSSHLAHDMRELVESFGGRATLSEKHPHYTYNGKRKKGKKAWVLIIALPPTIKPFRLSRKAELYKPRPKYPPSRPIVAVEYIGQKATQCIAVDAPDNLYITDRYIVTHNTLQTITLWLHERQRLNIAEPALLVCPTSVLGNWRHEIRKFAPALKTLVHHGADRLQDLEAFKQAIQSVDIVITSYALMRRDAEILGQIAWSDFVLDEAQNIKNASTKQAQAARAIPADFKLALTGTPVENRLTELWSILHFLNPGYLGSQEAFRSSFSTPIERYRDESAAQTLRQITAPFILRRLKTDSNIIQDLPEKFENKVYCSLSPEQATLYEAEVREALESVESAEDDITRRGNVLRMLTRLKQICNHPAHFFKEGTDTQFEGRSGKLERLVEMLDEVRANDERALIFTQYAEMGDLLQHYLKQYLLDNVFYLHGGTPAKQRDEMVRHFQSERGASVFILSLKAGGTGLTLTAANHVFHFDRWYNPAVENQATDRAFRIGQTKNVQVHKFICLGTLEERIDEMMEHKKALAESVVGAGENWISELSNDELRELVELRAMEVYE